MMPSKWGKPRLGEAGFSDGGEAWGKLHQLDAPALKKFSVEFCELIVSKKKNPARGGYGVLPSWRSRRTTDSTTDFDLTMRKPPRSFPRVRQSLQHVIPQAAQKKNPALAHGALLLTALGFQRLAVSHPSNLRLKTQKATAPR